jgi:hypothetical protein
VSIREISVKKLDRSLRLCVFALKIRVHHWCRSSAARSRSNATAGPSVVKNALVVFPDGNLRRFVTLSTLRSKATEDGLLTQSSLCVPLLALRLCVKESASKNRVSGYSCFQIVLRSRFASVPAAPHLQVLDAPPSSSFSSSSS